MIETACVHGHTKRQVGCVSCVLVFDNQKRSPFDSIARSDVEQPTSPPTLRHLAEAAKQPCSLDDPDYSYANVCANGTYGCPIQHRVKLTGEEILALLDERDAHAQQIATLQDDARLINEQTASVYQAKLDAAEARATTAERERDLAREVGKSLSELLKEGEAKFNRLREDRDRLQRELDKAKPCVYGHVEMALGCEACQRRL